MVPVKDAGQIFSERLASAKRKRAEVVQATMAQGAADAEKAFPKIVKEIESSAASGDCICTESVCGIARGKWSDDVIGLYCKGYQDRLAELVNDTAFSIEIKITENWCAVRIQW